ncbi:AAA family ATPase [Botrimarina mediterranea]|uniref:ATPase RavA n=1 Tax=Botrimarina mediterranea TaxID=2528022 RepID=A0A518KAN4_9BACT|nr:MoxR family ATPase [Botrimarina mediterranea]QDV74852.1 ATPase RavA [Botrimarina mediterranea]QDV79495.1 ATPase RavA [Planctomycetes bacterium K2D]
MALPDSDLEAIQQLGAAHKRLTAELGKVIVGQQDVVEQLLVALFARGHCVLEGVPGLAKTLLIHTLADALSLQFSRVQFTPDLMPADITGTEVIQEDKATGHREFRFLPGPVFANIVLADEINRTPPKTQAALLEAMQERQVTVGGERHKLPNPFFVLATQNPIEQEGTYPLPEAQLDRFMFMVKVDYPSEVEELAIVKQTTTDVKTSVTPQLSAEDLQSMADLVRRVPVADHLAQYAIRIVRQTRVGRGESGPSKNDMVDRYLSWGAGPRASQFLVLAAKARAALQGRHCVEMADLRAVAHPVLRHRIVTNFNAEADGVTPDHVIDRLLESTPAEAAA